MNSLVTALPGLVPIFGSAGGVNALAGVLLFMVCGVCLTSVPGLSGRPRLPEYEAARRRLRQNVCNRRALWEECVILLFM